LLEALQASPGAVVSMGSILQRVWGLLPTTKTRTLDTHVYRLRRAGYRISRSEGGLRLDGLPLGGAPGCPERPPEALDDPMLAGLGLGGAPVAEALRAAAGPTPELAHPVLGALGLNRALAVDA
jgi:Transcriptional regulatory protein, C terminal